MLESCILLSDIWGIRHACTEGVSLSPLFSLRQCVVELLHFRLWLIQGLSYISMVICLNIYFPQPHQGNCIMQSKREQPWVLLQLHFHWDWWDDRFQSICLPWNCMHQPYLPKGNGTCKLSGLQWSVGAEKKWLTVIMSLLLCEGFARQPCRGRLELLSSGFLLSLLQFRSLPEDPTSKTELKTKSLERAACKYLHRYRHTCTGTQLFRAWE